MHLIAFDTSTDRMSLAAQSGEMVYTREAPGSAQASATVLPLLQALMAQAGITFDSLDAVIFSRGPGSFTGLRTACSVAQGLAFGARQGLGVPVLPMDTLVALAEDARQRTGCTQVVAALDARMNEVYTAQLQWQPQPLAMAGAAAADGEWVLQTAQTLCAPASVQVPTGYTLAGNAGAVYGEQLAQGVPCLEAWPTATALLRLAPARWAAGMGVTADQALPQYIRDKVAQTTAERMAQRQQP